MITLDDITATVSRHEPLLLDTEGKKAAVALILRDIGTGPEILFIERATRAGDPWSGDIGFPGGRIEASDRDARSAAERETREETGIDLGRGEYLGRLSDLMGAHVPVHVACHVYRADTARPVLASDEVVDVFWVSVADLADAGRQVTSTVTFGGESFDRPSINLPVPGKPVLWGLTYRLVTAFLALLAEESPRGGSCSF